jgi:hypothetical protein
MTVLQVLNVMPYVLPIVHSFSQNFLFCRYPDTYDEKYKRGHKLIPGRTFDFQKSIGEVCKTRSDKWAEKVTSLLNLVIDLPAANAVYHNICSINFSTGKYLPLAFMDDDDSCTHEKRRRRKTQSPKSNIRT